MMNFSVIIRVKNEERWIGHAIQSTLDYLNSPQIVVIDNNSSDDSIEIVRSFRHDPALEKNEQRYTEVVVEKIHDYSPGRAINLGVSKCSFDKILILSAHCVIKSLPSLDTICALVDDYGCVFGKQIPIYRGRKITPRYLWSHFGDEKVENMKSRLEERLFLHNAFCFYSKEVLLSNPFDEYITGKEDRIWAANYVNQGNKYLYTPTMVANHHYTNRGNTWKGVG